MPSRPAQWLRDPLFLLCLTAGLLAFVVQSGELGTSDTTHRLQTTHWLWTSEPQVFPNEYPEFGLHGRGGRLYSWYGIGQSLLMLPADLLGTWIARWPVFSDYSDDPAVRSIVVSYSNNILVNILTALIAFRLLGQLRFSTKESVAGVLALMFCTTHLHYTQNMMENNYIMLLTLAGFSFQYEWLRTDSRRALFAGSCALGLNLLTRLTTGLDLIAAGIFVLLVLWFEGFRGRSFWRRLIAYCKVAAPVYLFFLMLDRAYQFYRYGSLTNTYVAIFAREERQIDPALPVNFPWSTPFHVGVLGALFKPEKSIFLFDPLLVLAIFLLALLWKRLAPEVRAYGASSVLLLLAYIGFYARYTYWAGDFAWGDRYVSTTVELVALVAVPLLMRYRVSFDRGRSGKNDLVRGMGVGRGQPDDSASIARFLVATGNLPDGNARTSDVCDCSASQEHRRLRFGQDGCLGLEQRVHDAGPVGLCSHHDVEFSAISAAPRWGSARLGGEFGAGHLACRDCGTWMGLAPVAKQLAIAGTDGKPLIADNNRRQ